MAPTSLARCSRCAQRSLGGAILFRAMVPLTPDTLPNIPATPVLISNGRMDPLVSAEETEHLAALLRSAGAEVTVAWQTAGHELTETRYHDRAGMAGEAATLAR